LTGGVIMVLAASTILACTAPDKKGVIGGVIFAGVGLGIAASGTLVPLLLEQGLKQVWHGLGVLSVLLTLLSWKAWPTEAPATHEGAAAGVAQAIADDSHAMRRVRPERGGAGAAYGVPG
jgi:hypothetical protein